MRKVRVKAGCKYGAGAKHEAGTVLEVSEDEYIAFGDKFEEVDEHPDATNGAVELAAELDIDLAAVVGTGKDGRILVGDVREHNYIHNLQ